MNMCETYQFRKNKYGGELLIDLIRLESLEKYIKEKPRHNLTYYDITLIHKGTGSFTLDGHEFPVKANHLYFTAPGQIREWKVNKMPCGLVLIFEEEFLCNFFNDALFVQKLSFFGHKTATPLLCLTADQGEHLTNIMHQIEQEISENKEKHLLRALLYQALAWLNKHYNLYYKIENKPTDSRVMCFCQLVERNFAEQHSVSFYANSLCISPGHLNYLVKKETGFSAKKLILNRITTEAKRLLLYSELSVAEIACKLSFYDPSYFVRLFRNETNTTPLAFRNNQND